ncbi:MAG: hypothetical protein PF439_06800 [Helicobacteraceae bacterium]|jgi:hypothetical protein|nr:hypothetical protein [Helicobacteraceae bacterium]
MRTKEHYEISRNLHKAEGNLAYILDVFGDEIAQREGYKEVDGMDAIHFYIVNKFKWLPSVVKAMSSQDLRFILSEEMSGWTTPEDAR